MSGPSNVSTDRGVPIQWWHGVAAGVVVWALLFATVDLEGAIATPLVDAVVLAALLAWPLVPVAMYLDLRRIRETAAWEPATRSWLLAASVPIVNVPAGLAYCLRRHSATRGRLPSAKWRFGVYAGFVGWIGIVAADVAVDHVSIGVLEPLVFGPLVFVVWLGFPVVLYLDAERERAYTGLSPNLRALVALSAVPLVNLVVGGAYVAGRWWHRRKADPDTEPTLPGETGADGVGSGRPEPLSPWYRRAVAVFVAYALLALAIGWGLSLESDLAWDGLALLAWPPFGIAFVVCIHFDLRDVREAGVPWGWTRRLYYTSVVFSGPAFWYLLRRLTKVHRARSAGWLEGDGNRDDGGDGEDGSDGSGSGGGGSDGGDGESVEEGTPSTGDGSPAVAPGSTDGPDGSAVGDATGFEWGDGSRG